MQPDVIMVIVVKKTPDKKFSFEIHRHDYPSIESGLFKTYGKTVKEIKKKI